MDFQTVLERLLDGFDSRKIRYATIGGFALGALGAARATKDLDFLVNRDDLGAVDALLTGLGYRLVHRSDDVSQYRHDSDGWGSVDLLHAFRPHALKIVARAASRPVFAGRRALRVARPEDLIGLKVQALWSNPLRRTLDSADIETLAELHGATLDWDEVREYYELFGLAADFEKLRERFGHAQ